MYSTSDFKNSLKIEMDSVPYEIVYFQHVKPGKGGAFVRTKLKNLRNGAVTEKTFRAGEKVQKPDIQSFDMDFLYQDEKFHFMNNSTYEQLEVDGSVVGDAAQFLKENVSVNILLYNGEVLSIELPAFVALEVTECEPGVRGDTVSGATKSATLETGATLQVPLFVNQGDKIKVDTRSVSYIERV